jgi:hypothetical protein
MVYAHTNPQRDPAIGALVNEKDLPNVSSEPSAGMRPDAIVNLQAINGRVSASWVSFPCAEDNWQVAGYVLWPTRSVVFP